MKCKEVYLHICENLNQDLDSPRCRTIKKHIQTCPDCSAYLDSVTKTVQLYKTAPAPRIPPHVHNTLLDTLNLELFKRRTPQRRSRRSGRTAR